MWKFEEALRRQTTEIVDSKDQHGQAGKASNTTGNIASYYPENMPLPHQAPRSSTQTAIIQCSESEKSASSPFTLKVCCSAPAPTSSELPSPHHVLVRVLAVALNPTDYKMVNHFPTPGNMVGCDFCGVVANAGSECLAYPKGTRVCGAVFPYNPHSDTGSGAFAQWVVADSRLLLRIPDGWDSLQGAALGGVGWGTAGLAFYDPQALNLQGRPSKPILKAEPVVVFGGATASGTIALQILRLSGYHPIAVTSTASAPLALSYGASGTTAYTSPTCIEGIKDLAGAPVRHALDCITSAESVAICLGAITRSGGRYACLEGLPASWKTRRAVQVKEVMGFEGLGVRIDLGNTPYSRDANKKLFEVCASWTVEMQMALDTGKIKTHPIRELPGKWEGVLKGLATLQRGEVRGEKLVVRIAES